MHNVLIIVGSGRICSHSSASAKYIAQVLMSKRQDVSVSIWDLAEKPLPFHDPYEHDNIASSKSNLVREFVTLASQSDAFVFCTPNYHSSISGVMKNGLDNLSIIQLRGKSSLIVVHGGNTSSTVCDHMRCMIRALQSKATVSQIMTSNANFEGNQHGFSMVDEDIMKRVDSACNELIGEFLKLRQQGLPHTNTSSNGNSNGNGNGKDRITQ